VKFWEVVEDLLVYTCFDLSISYEPLKFCLCVYLDVSHSYTLSSLRVRSGLTMPFECFSTSSVLWLLRLLSVCSSVSMAPKKRVKITAASTSRAPVARGNTSLPHVINKYRLVFVDAEHASRYDAIVTRKLSAPSYLDRQMLETLSLYNDLSRLLVNLGWVHFVELQEPVYERLVWEFMSSLVVDLRRKFDEVPGYIRFRLFNVTHEMHLVRFNELLHLHAYGALTPDHEDYTAGRFWHTITCAGKPYEARSSKASLICNPVLRYLQRLTANHVFPREDGQNGVRAGELFILWAALNRVDVNTGAFIASHLAEHARRTSKVVIAAGGIITALGRALGYGDRIARLPILYTPGRIDLTTCLNMHLFKLVGGVQVWVSHHGRALFHLPNPAKTTITRASNLLYDDAVDSEPGGVEGGDVPGARQRVSSDEDDDDDEDAPRVHRHRRQAPAGPSGVPPSAASASSSGAMGPSMFQTVLDRLDQLQMQNQEILRNQQNMAHMLHYAYECNQWPYPPPDWRPRGPPGPF